MNYLIKTTAMAAMLATAFSTSALAQDGKTLTYAEFATVDANWQMASSDSYIASRVGCYETLVRFNSKQGLEPELATAWEQVEPKVWDFTLRKGVMFQDCTPLTAAAAAGALNNLLTAEMPSGAFSPKVIESVEAIGEDVVRIHTLSPLELLPAHLVAPPTSILSPAAYEGGQVNPIGHCTGPFEIVDVKPKEYVSFKRNDNYWGGKPALEGGRALLIHDSNTRVNVIRSGEADIAFLIPPYSVAQLQGKPGITLVTQKAPRVTELLLNNMKKPFDDIRVRQAIKAAIDSNAIAASVYEGLSPATASPFGADEPWAPEGVAPSYDPAQAKALLAEAGFQPGQLQLELLVYKSRAELKDVGAIIQAQLGEIGIKVTLRVAEYAAIEPDMTSGTYDMALMSRGYLIDVADPIGYLRADYSCDGSFNMSHYCSEEFDGQLDKASSLSDPNARYEIYAQLAKQVSDEANTVFLVNETLFDARKDNVANFEMDPLNFQLMTKDVTLQ
ncbi:MAG: ABC transporter substrate-binding protein [Maritimibacter sp.]